MKALLVRPGWGDAGFVVTDPTAMGALLGALNGAIPVKEGFPLPKHYGVDLLVTDSTVPPLATIRVDLIEWPTKAEGAKDATGREWGDPERVAEREKWAADQAKAGPWPAATAPAAPARPASTEDKDDVPF